MNISDWCKSKAGPSTSRRAHDQNQDTALTQDESMEDNDWSEMRLDPKQEHLHVDFDASFSSRDGSRMESDSIQSFSESEVYTMSKAFVEDDVEDSQQTQLTSTENILSGLDRWHPTKGTARSPSPIPSGPNRHDDILSIDDDVVDDDDDSWPSPVQAMDNDHNEQQQPSFHVQNEPIHMPEPPTFKTVTPTPSQEVNTHTTLRPFIKLKKQSMGFKAMEDIIQACKEHDMWLRQVREEVVNKGSIARLCVSSEEAQLFRIVQTWKDHGVLFGRCARLNQDEINYILRRERDNINTLGNTQQDDVIEESYSQPVQLPPYDPGNEDEQFICVFSFAYMHAPDSTRNKFLNEEWVAIWPPWTHKKLPAERDIYIVTRFMSQSIY